MRFVYFGKITSVVVDCYISKHFLYLNVSHCRNNISFVDIKLYYMKQKYQLRNSGAFKINHFRMHHQKLLLNLMIIC